MLSSLNKEMSPGKNRKDSVLMQVRRECVALLFCAGLSLQFHVNAQQKDPCIAGVFLTEDDFINNRLSYKINTEVEGNKMGFVFPADATLTLRITTPDSTRKFPPGSIYGYASCGNIFRFFEGGKELNAQEDFYKIEQAEDLIIYSSGFVSGDELFYSKDLTSPIHRLTFANLKRDFGNYPEFIAEAKKLKRKPEGLATRNEKGFAILRLYTERGTMTSKE
jgi:hypothetical protein